MIVSDRTAKLILTIDRFALGLVRHWLFFVNVIFGVFVLAPFAAPILMQVGATSIADAIYFIYSFLCHQLPQRSYFIFGPKLSYSLAEIENVWHYGDSMLGLRQFIGNDAMGWKVAWSDRMVSMYGSLWVGGLLYALLRKHLPRLSSIAWLVLAIVPMALDGFSHMLNDLVAGVSGTGFRDTNAWLQFLTVNIFSADFYAGDALGSFNSLARLVTGALFGLATIWFVYPFIDTAMHDVVRQAQSKLASPRAIVLGRLPSHQEGK
ncbi:MAG: DUF2085 domain-containing protein [Chloroflexi bacterium]|nr:DUF2085 domain-containing protein [Chloroflexota bacterium]